MNRISDVLELLTSQHEEIERLVGLVMETTDLEVRATILNGLGDKLTTHLAVEQELLYPELGGIVPVEVMREVLSEHVEIKKILADLLWLEPEGTHFETRLTAMLRLLGGHAAWQENDLFARVAETFSPAKLATLGETVHGWCEPPAFEIRAA